MKGTLKTIDKLAWIEIRNKTILATRSKGKSVFYIPGGKREPGESDAEALVREIREELTVNLQDRTMRLIGVFEAQAHGHAEGVSVKMTCYSAAYEGTLSPASEIEEVRWLTSADREVISEVDKLIFDFLKKEGKIS